MPLPRIRIPSNLVVDSQPGYRLNRKGHPQLNGIEGEPESSTRESATREAFAALSVLGDQDVRTKQPRVFLGEAAVRFVYSRGKRTGERDCDVVGNTQRYGRPGYLLAEGKGANIRDAKGQFDAVAVELKNRMEGRGPIFNAIVATTSLRYIQWHAKRNQWIAYLDDVEQPMITDRLAENVARSARELDRNRVYLLDGEADDNQLPRWAMTVSATPFRVFQQMRTDTFHPLLVGEGQILVYYGAS